MARLGSIAAIVVTVIQGILALDVSTALLAGSSLDNFLGTLGG